ncbi:inositol polyphosphate-5-phosphatase A isoform X1 [Lates japonicus]|uniref:Inositol polyphosphate-5-phosphatase A isoform X1 n=1 Tax=Lates japonicus TaxID=270547 RepID=A0AAD3N378_LATJO|nr:inositol polyphosphate-5-phosphatase A isoform X1 [Lates japonicus]
MDMSAAPVLYDDDLTPQQPAISEQVGPEATRRLQCIVNMETFTDVLLVTANVGSLFDNLGEIQSEWLQELYKTIHIYKPQFIALHFQEVGGKDYMVNMGHAENFFWTIESNEEMKDYDRVCIYVDNQFQAEDGFTPGRKKGSRQWASDRVTQRENQRMIGLDLVNVHLFHDASNLTACESSPSIYSANRKNALRYVINRLISI